MTLSEAETHQGQITQCARTDSLSKEILNFQYCNFGPFCLNHIHRNGMRHNENLMAVPASLRLFPDSRMVKTRFKIAAQTLMTFAGKFFTEEI